MSSSEDLEALRIHGLVFDRDSISDEGKSEFDDYYFALKPPPIVINDLRHTIISIPSRTAPITQDSAVHRKIKLNSGEDVRKSFDSNALLTKKDHLSQVRTINPKLNVNKLSKFSKKSNNDGSLQLSSTQVDISRLNMNRKRNVPKFDYASAETKPNNVNYNLKLSPSYGKQTNYYASDNGLPRFDNISSSLNVSPAVSTEIMNTGLDTHTKNVQKPDSISQKILTEYKYNINSTNSTRDYKYVQPSHKEQSFKSPSNEIIISTSVTPNVATKVDTKSKTTKCNENQSSYSKDHNYTSENQNLAVTNQTTFTHTESTNRFNDVGRLYTGEFDRISNFAKPPFNEIVVPTEVTRDASPKLKPYTKNDNEILETINVTPENDCSSIDQINPPQPPRRTKRTNLRSQGNKSFSNVHASSNATHRNIPNVLPETNSQTEIASNMYSSTEALTRSERSNSWFDTVLSYLCCK